MKRIIITGATSGIGKEVARLYINEGWIVGIAGRQEAVLKQLQELAPDRIFTQVIDITREDAGQLLDELIMRIGGMDIYFHSSGTGSQNAALDETIEIGTVKTNAEGFTRMMTTAYRFFRKQNKGHIAAISSIAGTKGLGAAPAYSATKRFQNIYIDALAQMARMEKFPLVFTDIRPGFVRTPLLKGDPYPLLMDPVSVAVKIKKAVDRKKRRVVIDWKYAILVFFWKLIPAWLWERLPVKNR